jgi:hypothetical protein
MKRRQLHQDLVLSDAEVRDVIERALREESTGQGISIAELRSIAAELDIEPSALEAALDQVVGLPIPGQPIRSWLKRQMTRLGRLADSFLPRTGRVLGFAIFGGIAGWLNSFLTTFSINAHYPIAAAMIGLTAANLLGRRIDQKLHSFILETLATWLLYGVAWSVTYGGVNDRIVFWVVFWASQASMLGYILMRDRSGGTSDAAAATALDVSSPSATNDTDLETKRISVKRSAVLQRFLLRPV